MKIIKYEPSFLEQNPIAIAEFNCGEDGINRLFKKDLEHLCATTFLFLDDAEPHRIIAFVSFCASSLQISAVRQRQDVPHTFPAVEMKLFGVDCAYQSQPMPLPLIMDTPMKYSEFAFLWLCSYLKKRVVPLLNVEYLVLHSLPNEKAMNFYKKMGMQEFSGNEALQSDALSEGCVPMYLKL